MFVIMSAFKIQGYGKWLVASLLQLAYLEKVGHPVIDALLKDHNLFNEEKGESKFSALARATATDPNRVKLKNLDTRWRQIGAFGDVTRDFSAEASLKVGASHRHIDHLTHRRKEVDAVETALRTRLLPQLRDDCYSRFILDGTDKCTQKYIHSSVQTTECNHAPVYIGQQTICYPTAIFKDLGKELPKNNYHGSLQEYVDEFRNGGE